MRFTFPQWGEGRPAVARTAVSHLNPEGRKRIFENCNIFLRKSVYNYERAKPMLLFLFLIESEDDRAFVEELYNEYREVMFRVARSVLKDASDAEDAVQTVFMNVASKHIGTLKGLEGVRRRSYLLAAVKYASLTMLRSKVKTVSLDKMLDAGVDPSANDEDFTEWVCANCDKNGIIEAMGRLDPLYGIVLYYRYGEELSTQQIAELLGRKHSTVRQQLARGRQLLMKELSAKGGEQLAY